MSKILAAITAAGVLAGCQGGRVVAMPVEANSSGSEVADSAVILVVDVLAASFSPWQPEADGSGLKSRQARLQLRPREVLKGQIRQALNAPFDVTVNQRGTGGTRVMDFYGVWSHAPLAPNIALMIFCKAAADDPQVLFSEDNIGEIVEASKAYTDTRAATLLEARQVSGTEALTLAARVAPQYGDVFARLLWHLVRAEVLRNVTALDQLMKIVENPETKPSARETYITRAYEELGLQKSPSRELEIRLAQAMFRVLELKDEGELKQAVAEVYLPNLLGLSQGKEKYKAAEVLTGAPFNPTRLAVYVGQVSADARAQALASWLRGERRK